MTSETFNKDIAVFIFNENIYLARTLKEKLSQRAFDAHFYTDEALVRQAVYLALPHIVVLPAAQKNEKLIHDIRKMSSEIHIVVIGSEDEYEAILALNRKKLADDFIIDPVNHLEAVVHRVQTGAERWLLMNQLEELRPRPLFKNTNTFIEDSASKREPFQDSLIMDILAQTDEDAAVTLTLERVSAITGLPYIYFVYDRARDILALKNVSFGERRDLKGLGIRLNTASSIEEYLKEPLKYKVTTEFLQQVFEVPTAEVHPLREGEDIFGVVMCLAAQDTNAREILGRALTALALKVDNLRKSRWIFNNIQMDRDFACINGKTFYSKISDEISRARRLGLPLSLGVFEVTAKSRAEARHAATILVKVLKRFTRVTDIVGRTQGERFGVLLAHCPLTDATTKVRRLLSIAQAALEENGLASADVRAGLAVYPDQQTDAMSLLESSESACDIAARFEVCIIESEDKSTPVNKKQAEV